MYCSSTKCQQNVEAFTNSWGNGGQKVRHELCHYLENIRVGGERQKTHNKEHTTFELTWLQLWRFTQVSITSTVASSPSPSAPPPPSTPPTSPGWCLAGLWGVRGTFGGQGRGGGGRLGGWCCWWLWLELWVGACRHWKTEHTPEQKDEKCYHITAQYYTIHAAPTLPQWWWAVSHPLRRWKTWCSAYTICVQATKSPWQARMLLYCDQWQNSVMFHHCSRFLGLNNRTFIMDI